MEPRSHSTRTNPFVLGWRKSLRYYLWTASLAVLVIGCNVAVLWANIHTFRLGYAIIHSNTRFLTDDNFIAVIHQVGGLLDYATRALSALALSQLWCRRLCESVAGIGLAELQTLEIPTSVFSIGIVFTNLIRRNLPSATPTYIFIMISGIMLHTYATAIVTLSVPTLDTLYYPPRSFSYVERPFLSDQNPEKLCKSPKVKGCLGATMAANTMVGVLLFDTDGADPTQWTIVNTEYSFGLTMYNFLGPSNNLNLTAGAALIGNNMGTLDGLLNSDASAPDLYDSVAFNVTVNTTIPIVISQCIKLEWPVVSNLTIDNHTYHLPIPVSLLDAENIVGQVTTDDISMVVSYRSANSSSNIHCAINLGLRNGSMRIESSATDPKTYAHALFEPWGWTNASTELSRAQIPIGPFARVWLEGMGWSSTPTRNEMSTFLSASVQDAGLNSTSQDFVDGTPFADEYMLVMLASGISTAFPPEIPPSDSHTDRQNISTRSYTLSKTEYYVGRRSPLRYFLAVIIYYNCMFVCWCLYVIFGYRRGWFPDWTERSALACLALSSPPEKKCRESADGEVRKKVYQELRLSLKNGDKMGEVCLTYWIGGEVDYERQRPSASSQLTAQAIIRFTTTEVLKKDRLSGSSSGRIAWPSPTAVQTPLL
ncbi:hypothetical protein EW146_g6029 [Bondarzewia mesenterica]|uniref:Transmembrane protein n=1 Tax=Bondarzewia mesenterica TaxID=1095465 RepID=A0A4S4LPR9_9AGAM|nr:hypothetical protein EW146_g6029 [Bondarzewia mesenterica]